MWLVVRERCWTADQLAWRGLPHPSYCPLCDKEEKYINHLLSTHMSSHENFGFSFYAESAYNLTLLSDEISFDDWWDRTSRREISLDD